MSKLNNETNNKINNVEYKEETNMKNTMKKITKKITNMAIMTTLFTAFAIIGFYTFIILTRNKAADTEAEASMGAAIENKVTTETTENIDPPEEHEHIWESVGHVETIDGKSTYIEDYERCSICGEKR